MGLYCAQFRSYHTEVCWEHPLNAGLWGGGFLCAISKVPARCVGSWIKFRKRGVLVISKQ